MPKKLHVLLPAFLCLLPGCSGQAKYHAVLYDSAEEWIDEAFKAANPISLSMTTDDTFLLKKRFFLVTSQGEYDETFATEAEGLKVTFDTQMLVVYTFVSIDHQKNRLVSIALEDQTLDVTYDVKNPCPIVPCGYASSPYQRWFVLQLDRLDVVDVAFHK